MAHHIKLHCIFPGYSVLPHPKVLQSRDEVLTWLKTLLGGSGGLSNRLITP